MAQSGSLLLALAAVVTMLMLLLLLAVWRLGAVGRQGGMKGAADETLFLATAVGQAVSRLRERERATHARAVATERLNKEIVASLQSGLIVVGVEGEVRILNAIAQRLLRLPEVAIGSPYQKLFGSRCAPLVAALAECLSETRPITHRAISLEGASAGDVPSHFGVSVSPLYDGEGEPHGAICLFSDVTAVVELTERVRLQEGLARVGELTAGIAHEFRNGLATIHGYGRLFDLEQLPVAYRPYVKGIREETASLREVVERFLAFARPTELSLAPVVLEGVMRRVTDDLRREIDDEHGVITVSGTFGTVDGDEVLLRQAVMNLCRNALEACRQVDRLPRVTIEGKNDGPRRETIVSVIDNGPGMDVDTMKRAFQPFFTTKPTGTGLGLALTQKIIVTHNGRVSVDCVKDGGSRFEISLPLSSSNC